MIGIAGPQIAQEGVERIDARHFGDILKLVGADRRTHDIERTAIQTVGELADTTTSAALLPLTSCAPATGPEP